MRVQCDKWVKSWLQGLVYSRCSIDDSFWVASAVLHTGDIKKNKIPFLHSIECSAVGRADRFKKHHVFSGLIATRPMRSANWSALGSLQNGAVSQIF